MFYLLQQPRSFRFPALPLARRRRAMTLVEMMISASVFSVIGVAVMWVVLAAARTSKEGLSFIQSEARGRIVLDNIRRECLVGEFLSVNVLDSGKTVQFYDPIKDSTAQFQFNEQTKTVVYKPDMGGSVVKQFKGIQDTRFSLQANRTMLRFEVTLLGRDGFNNIRPIRLMDEVLLRNLPSP